MRIKDQIKDYFIGRGQITDHKPGIVSDIKNPKSLCLFFTIYEENEIHQIIDLVKSINNNANSLSVFVFNRSKKLTEVITHQAIFCFDFNDFDIFGKKSEMLSQRFNSGRFEMLISFAGLKDKASRKLVSEIDAAFKVGQGNPYQQIVFDLIIAEKGASSFKQYYEYVKHYISVLNITTQ